MASLPSMPPAYRSPKKWRSSGPKISNLSAPRPSGWTRRPKVNDTAVYGMDARPAGVKIATFARSPVFGRCLKHVDDSAAKVIKKSLPRNPCRRIAVGRSVAPRWCGAKKNRAPLADRRRPRGWTGRQTPDGSAHRAPNDPPACPAYPGVETAAACVKMETECRNSPSPGETKKAAQWFSAIGR